MRSLAWHGKQIQCQQDITRACPQTFGLVTEVDKETVQSRRARRTASGSLSAIGVGVQEAAFVIARAMGEQEGGSQLYNFRTILKGLPFSLLLCACQAEWKIACGGPDEELHPMAHRAQGKMSAQPSSCIAGSTALEKPLPQTELPDMIEESPTAPWLHLANQANQGHRPLRLLQPRIQVVQPARLVSGSR